MRYTNRREAPQLSSDDGTFVSYGFIPGPVMMEVTRENYDTAKIEASAIANGETKTIGLSEIGRFRRGGEVCANNGVPSRLKKARIFTCRGRRSRTLRSRSGRH